jgi:hypothetical protein
MRQLSGIFGHVDISDIPDAQIDTCDVKKFRINETTCEFRWLFLGFYSSAHVARKMHLSDANGYLTSG